MSSSTCNGFRIASPAQFAVILPALVGFTPLESFVVVYFRDDAVMLTMRRNLTPD